jgi:hypothetical protein
MARDSPSAETGRKQPAEQELKVLDGLTGEVYDVYFEEQKLIPRGEPAGNPF